MEQNRSVPKIKDRLKGIWKALGGKNKLAHFFHDGLSICPIVTSLGLPLCGGFKQCIMSSSACPVKCLPWVLTAGLEIVQGGSPSSIRLRQSIFNRGVLRVLIESARGGRVGGEKKKMK